MDAKTGIVRKKEASSASLQPHVPRPSREEEGANQTGIPPSPPLSPLFTRRTVPLRSTSGGTEPAEPRSRAAGRRGRRDAARPQLPFPFQPRPPSTALRINPPNPQPESSARSAAPCAHSLPTHSRTPEAVGGRKANRCPPRPSPSPTSPRDAPSPLCK